MNRSDVRHIAFDQALDLEISFSIGELFTERSRIRDRHSIDTQASRTADPGVASLSLTRQGVGPRGTERSARCQFLSLMRSNLLVTWELPWSFRGNFHPRFADKSSAFFCCEIFDAGTEQAPP